MGSLAVIAMAEGRQNLSLALMGLAEALMKERQRLENRT